MLRSASWRRPLNRQQYNVIEEISQKYTKIRRASLVSIRLTNRQNIQFHWIKKQEYLSVLKLCWIWLNTLNGCGIIPVSHGLPYWSFLWCFKYQLAWPNESGALFPISHEPFISVWQIDPNKSQPGESFSLWQKFTHRKFKIGFARACRWAWEFNPDNCLRF